MACLSSQRAESGACSYSYHPHSTKPFSVKKWITNSNSWFPDAVCASIDWAFFSKLHYLLISEYRYLCTSCHHVATVITDLHKTEKKSKTSWEKELALVSWSWDQEIQRWYEQTQRFRGDVRRKLLSLQLLSMFMCFSANFSLKSLHRFCLNLFAFIITQKKKKSPLSPAGG